jgi:prepilin-type N-terminal cleavage/methylation domain-containing protein
VKHIRHERFQAGPRRRGRGPAAAFTLLEMLTVIIIVGLLLSIGTPSILRMQVIIMRNSSLATVNVIDGACKMYWNDFEEFPHSNPDGLLRVYDYTAKSFRDPRRPKGKLYGPYNGCETIKSDGQIFFDAFDYPILYYRWDQRGGESAPRYHDQDNPQGPSNITMYAKTNGYDGRVLRTDFILLSRGPDGKWPHEVLDKYGGDQRRAYAERDDITNFLQEE